MNDKSMFERRQMIALGLYQPVRCVPGPSIYLPSLRPDELAEATVPHGWTVLRYVPLPAVVVTRGAYHGGGSRP